MIHLLLEQRLRDAVATVLPDANLASVFVRPCPDPKFGDYQTNSLMALAKERKINPRQLATDVLAKLDVKDVCEKVEIAGAGFLNFQITPAAVGEALASAARGEHLFFAKASQPRTIVIDFSSPNVAKPMHVGHIRSTILGDSLARVLRLLGHQVITDNHIGDWGTQFGMLLVGWKKHLDRTALERDAISEMERLYKLISAACKENPAVLEEAREELVKLQRGDEENLRIWREMIALSQIHFDTIYARLGVKFDYTLGESFYNPKLQAVVDDLKTHGLARESEGAMAIFFDDVPQLKDKPALVQKSDGGFNYTTTDLATLQHRVETWQPQEIIYVTDGRQQLHFQQLFTAFRRWQSSASLSPQRGEGLRVRGDGVDGSPPFSKPLLIPTPHPDPLPVEGRGGQTLPMPRVFNPKLAHVWFGSILGEDGKPFKTRSGETVKLAELLDEAEERALKVVTEKNADLPEASRREIARVVGLGAVKYADLLPNRQSDYVFSWDKMLSLQGNTAPYLQYAYARIRSIFRKAGEGTSNIEHRTPNIELKAPEELALAKHLLNFGLTLEAVAEDYRPNFLCNYLYDLAGHFARFYEACPVLKAEGHDRAARLTLCDVTARVLQQGLDTLGIEVLEQM